MLAQGLKLAQNYKTGIGKKGTISAGLGERTQVLLDNPYNWAKVGAHSTGEIQRPFQGSKVFSSQSLEG